MAELFVATMTSKEKSQIFQSKVHDHLKQVLSLSEANSGVANQSLC
jgi:hypothetical protein